MRNLDMVQNEEKSSSKMLTSVPSWDTMKVNEICTKLKPWLKSITRIFHDKLQPMCCDCHVLPEIRV